jgi:hypothetical protein
MDIRLNQFFPANEAKYDGLFETERACCAHLFKLSWLAKNCREGGVAGVPLPNGNRTSGRLHETACPVKGCRRLTINDSYRD